MVCWFRRAAAAQKNACKIIETQAGELASFWSADGAQQHERRPREWGGTVPLALHIIHISKMLLYMFTGGLCCSDPGLGRKPRLRVNTCEVRDLPPGRQALLSIRIK